MRRPLDTLKENQREKNKNCTNNLPIPINMHYVLYIITAVGHVNLSNPNSLIICKFESVRKLKGGPPSIKLPEFSSYSSSCLSVHVLRISDLHNMN